MLLANTLTISEGTTVVLSTANLNAFDPSPSQTQGNLVFSITNVQRGKFIKNGNETTSFTLADVTASLISFQHDGSETKPAYDVTVTDDDNETDGPQAATVFFTNVSILRTLLLNETTDSWVCMLGE